MLMNYKKMETNYQNNENIQNEKEYINVNYRN